MCPPKDELPKHLNALVFSTTDLANLNIEHTDLKPFMLSTDNSSIESAKAETATYLEKTPLIHIENKIYLISPHDVSPAIRHHIISTLSKHGYMNEILRAIASHQSSDIEEQVLRNFTYDTAPIASPTPDAGIPPISSWLLRYDTRKAIHIVLLHDDWSNISTGFDSHFEYSPGQVRCLTQFLSAVVEYCLEDLRVQEGYTLLVAGGAGRSIAIPDYADRRNWHKSSINIFDLLLLSDRENKSLDQYLKFIRHRHELELSGVAFAPQCTDFDLYSCWISNKYSLIDGGSYIGDFDYIAILPLWTLEGEKRM